MSADDGAGTREVARRLFAAEYDDATLSYSESDEERAPNYVVTPTGARVNRLFAVGVLTATESVNDDMLRARVVDTTGAFVAYAGQYQPEALAFFERATPPAFVALTAKARTFQPEDSEQVFTSARPETVNEVDADTRDRWTVSAAKATLRRISLFDAALSSGLRGDDLESHLREHDIDEALATGVPRAIAHYGTATAYLDAVRRLALDSLAVVAGEREEVRELALAPDEGGAAALGQIPDNLRAEESIATPEAATESATTERADATGAGTDPSTTAPDIGATTETSAETNADATSADANADATSAETNADAPSADANVDAPNAEKTTTDDSVTDAPTDTVEASTETAPAERSTDTDPTPDANSGAEPQSDPASVDGLGSFDDSLASEIDASADDTATTEEPDSGTDLTENVDPTTNLDPTGDTEDSADPADIDVDVDDDELYEFDEGEREAVREEHGLSFESGSEIGSPGEAGIETPDVTETQTAEAAETETPDVTETGTSSSESTDTADGTADITDEAPVEESAPADAEPETVETDNSESPDDAGTAEAEDSPVDDDAEADLTEIVVEVMDDLDEGNGADREKVIAAVVQRSSADPGATEDAIQEALMDGKCYEPGDGRLKAI